MKTILLWDLRFPDRRPTRLTLPDALASAAVRSGAATAADPAQAGALAAGGALDGTMLTEVVLQHGINGDRISRIMLPYSVVVVGAGLGLLASIGTPIAGGVTPTPTPTPGTPTPQEPEEALIVPANTTLRTTYAMTKVGRITGRPPSMVARGGGGNGPDYPNVVPLPSTTYPDRRLCYYATDHDHSVSSVAGSGTGGMYVLVCVGNPRLVANWKTFADAKAAGWLTDIANLPASEPLYRGPYTEDVGSQSESICVNWVPEGNCFVATIQIGLGVALKRIDGSQYANQGTIMATSADGFNWTGDNICITAVPSTDPGDKHTGYFWWKPNPFPGALNPATGNPWKYVGYSLNGGSGSGGEKQWGSDNPAAPANTQPWTAIANMNIVVGRAAPDYPTSNTRCLLTRLMDLGNVRLTQQGYYAVPMVVSPVSPGSDIANRTLWEVPMDSAGRKVMARPTMILDRGASGDFDVTSATKSSMFDFADSRVMIYQGQTDETIGNQLMLATSPKRNPGNSIFAPLDPPIPTDAAMSTISFKGLSAIPAGWTAVWGGTDQPVVTYDAGGMTVALDPAKNHEFYLFEDAGFLPQYTPIADVSVSELISLSGGTRVPMIGFSAEKVIRANMQNALFVSNGEGTASDGRITKVAAGVTTQGTNWNTWVGFGYGAASKLAGQNKEVGLRWFPRGSELDATPRLIGLGAGRDEAWTEAAATLAGFDLTKRYYRFIGWKAAAGSTMTERIGGAVTRLRSYENELESIALSGNLRQGVAATGTVLRSRQGSVITSNIPDITFDNGVFPPSYSGTPTANGTFTLTETKPGATGSPKPSPVNVAEGVNAVVYDTFTGTNGALLTAHTPDVGGAWSLHAGATNEPVLQSGRLTGSSLGSSQFRLLNAAVPPVDHYVEADFTVVSLAGEPMLTMRMDDASQTGFAVGYTVGQTAWRISTLNGGTRSTIGTAVTATLTVGQTYRVRAETRVTSPGGTPTAEVKLFVDDMVTPIATATSTLRTGAGKTGVRTQANGATPTAGIHIDNFKVGAL